MTQRPTHTDLRRERMQLQRKTRIERTGTSVEEWMQAVRIALQQPVIVEPVVEEQAAQEMEQPVIEAEAAAPQAPKKRTAKPRKTAEPPKPAPRKNVVLAALTAGVPMRKAFHPRIARKLQR